MRNQNSFHQFYLRRIVCLCEIESLETDPIFHIYSQCPVSCSATSTQLKIIVFISMRRNSKLKPSKLKKKFCTLHLSTKYFKSYKIIFCTGPLNFLHIKFNFMTGCKSYTINEMKSLYTFVSTLVKIWKDWKDRHS